MISHGHMYLWVGGMISLGHVPEALFMGEDVKEIEKNRRIWGAQKIPALKV